jgi:hypothetical protein
MYKRKIPWLITLLCIVALISPVGANAGYPIKMLTLGEVVDYGVYNLNPSDIIPANTEYICRLYHAAPNITSTIFDCQGKPVDPSWSVSVPYWVVPSVDYTPQEGEYYAVPYGSKSLGVYSDGIHYLAVGSRMNDPDFKTKNIRLYTVLPKPAPTIPTPSLGSVVITSNPSGATIFLDNAIKGITPLTLESIPNGAHTVMLRLMGYEDATSSITVFGNTQTINPTLTHSPIVTTAVTTIPTTTSVTTTTTTVAIITELTTTATTATPTPTATVNYSATIAALEKQMAEQNAKIEEQGNWIDQILRFLGLK